MKRKNESNLGKIMLLLFAIIAVFFVGTGCTSSAKKDKATKPAQIGKSVAESPIEEKDTTAYKAEEEKKAAKEKEKALVVSQGPQKGKVYSIVIDKSNYTLTLMQDGEPLKSYKVAIGINKGQKQAVGDLRTPDGNFTVDEICEASYWTHNFGDGKGEIKGAYGPWFISLNTPGWSGIGIHGTHDPASIGTRASEGCVRMHNNELRELVKFVKDGTKVKIEE
ncbi:MAG: L,D-transpeptidase [Acidaminococcaceae bacterium]|jgi:lipoprotein-anchoring transpeptidase ErfK/SrfK|nr:L,D-transpeptidase [Acidaminococcaceae bacterium]MCI2110336.1 L,D-transpeptidase [Acidaminococcaceae bacterium]